MAAGKAGTGIVTSAWMRFRFGFLSSGYCAQEEPEFLRRVRIINLTGLVLMVFGVTWAVSFLIHGAWVLGLVLTGMCLAYAGVLAAVRLTRRLDLIAHCLMALLLCAVTVSNWFTGGLNLSNDVAVFLVPIVAIFLLGPRGLVWVGLAVIQLGVFTWVGVQGYVFPHVIPEENRALDATLTWLTVLLVIGGVTYLYDRSARRSSRQLMEARDRAEEANRAKSRFLANMSHEFRTPLNAVIGLTELTLKGELPDSQRSHLVMVKKSALTLLTLIDDVLDIARIEVGRLSLRPGSIDLRTLLQEIVNGFHYRAQSKGIDLVLEVSDSVARLVKGDGVRLRQVISNLLDNAIKFTDQGRVTLELGLEADGNLLFVVTDTGVGIEPEKQEVIFDAFCQGDQTATRKHGGCGLGLAICRDLVAMMDGSIRLHSQLGAGSRFEVRLRLPELKAASSGSQGPRVLAAEDDKLSQELLATILKAAGFRVDVVGDGLAALAKLSEHAYDLVLMDIQMPGMDGLEAVRRIRAQEDGIVRIPILALTAHALDEERQRCFDAGMDDFITKPIEPEMLLDALRRWSPGEFGPGQARWS
jgi:signal transduction histidine kinase/BarA-like signal transduction histidine kinase